MNYVTRDVTRFFIRLLKPLTDLLRKLPTCLLTHLSTGLTPQNLQPRNQALWIACMIKFLKAEEVCDWLRINRKALWQLEKSGELIPDRIGRRLRYREHEVIEFLDREREKQKANYGRPNNEPLDTNSQALSAAGKVIKSSELELGTGVSENDIAAINPVSERSIYTSIYATLSAGTPVSEINAEFASDTDYLAANYLEIGSAV
jgi:predicted DNA-binding transcriptional regulator AlpA